MRMSQRVHSQAGDKIQIASAFEIVEKNTFSARQYDRIAVISLHQEGAFTLENPSAVVHEEDSNCKNRCEFRPRHNPNCPCLQLCLFPRFVRSFAKRPLRMTDRDAAQILILYVALPRFVINTSLEQKT